MNTRRDDRQKRVADWCENAFGTIEATSLPQRGMRLLEEACEAAQAAGCSREQVYKVIDHVFGRPVGEIGQELGGVAVTTLALAHAAGLSAETEEIREVERVLSRPIEDFRKRNAEKNAAGLIAVEGHVAVECPECHVGKISPAHGKCTNCNRNFIDNLPNIPVYDKIRAVASDDVRAAVCVRCRGAGKVVREDMNGMDECSTCGGTGWRS